MRWYVLLALLVIVTLLLIQESDGWRRRGGFRLRRSVRFRTRRLRRTVRFRTRRLRRSVRFRTRRLRRSFRFRTRRLRRSFRFRTRRLRRSFRFRTRRLRRSFRFRTRRLRRSFRFRTRRLRRSFRFRTRRLRRSFRFRTRRLRRSFRFRTRKLRRLRFRVRLSRIRTRKILKRFKLKRWKRKVKKLIKKVKKKLKKSGKWWKLIKGKLKNIGVSVLKQLYNHLLKKKGSGNDGDNGDHGDHGDNGGPGVQPPPGTAPPPTPAPTEDPLLVVQQGEFTFLAEGNDDPSSPYFSRRLHVFSNSSGVTVGRGYGLKDRTTTHIKTDLLAVGINRNIAEKLTNAIHLEGDRAKAWIKSNKLESFTITKQQQKTLFEREYPRQVSRAKAMTEKYTTTGLKFDQLKQVVKDIIVDIFYRGDYSMNDFNVLKKERSIIMQEAFDQSKTNLTVLTILMLDEDFWVNEAAVDKNRFYVRANYIDDACNKDKQNCNPQKSR